MAVSKGFGAKFGMAKNTQATWALMIANPNDATDLITVTSETLTDDRERVLYDYIHGGAQALGDELGVKPITGDINVQVVYDTKEQDSGATFWGCDLLFALAMGSKLAFDGANNSNRLVLADTLSDLAGTPICGTGAVDKQISTTPWQYNGMYFNGFTVTGNAKEGVTATFPVQCYDIDRAAGGNTAAELTTLLGGFDDGEQPRPLVFSDLAFWIGDDANALASTDAYGISSFTFTFNRNLTEPTFTSPDNATGHTATMAIAGLPIEPVCNGMREVTLSITIPRYTTDQFYTWRDAGEKLQALIDFDKGTGAAELNWMLHIPTLKIETITNQLAGAGLIETVVTFKCFKIHADNIYMDFLDGTLLTHEFGIEMRNETNGRTAIVF